MSVSAPTLEDVWRLFQETDRRFQETDRKWQETERLLRAQWQETDRKFQETDRRFQETDRKWQETERLLRAQWQETDRKFQETDRKFQETDRKFQETDRRIQERMQETDRLITRIGKQLGELGGRLGEFVEELVRPAVIRLFRERGLEVHQVMRDVTAIAADGEDGIEIDLLLTDTDTAIGVECKSRLTQEDVDEHLWRLAKFKRLFPQYDGYRLLGAVAAMVLPDEVARYAYRQGLFVLAQSGDAVLIRNDAKFVPKVW